MGFISGCTQEKPQFKEPVEKITIAALFAGDAGVLVYITEDQGYFRNNVLTPEISGSFWRC
jgi:hypothetical protein